MNIPDNWIDFTSFIEKDNNLKNKYNELENFINNEDKNNKIYPPINLRFNALEKVSPNNVNVVIIGQDVYFREGQAMGLAFSVPINFKIPPSLKNIYKSMIKYIGDCPKTGDLTYLTNQGVLLLNSALTVQEGKPNSHQKQWKFFTDELIKWLSNNYKNIVFILWGNYAKKKSNLINKNNEHLIIEGVHPSPLAHRGGGEHPFLSVDYFNTTNKFLEKKNKSIINW